MNEIPVATQLKQSIGNKIKSTIADKLIYLNSIGRDSFMMDITDYILEQSIAPDWDSNQGTDRIEDIKRCVDYRFLPVIQDLESKGYSLRMETAQYCSGKPRFYFYIKW